MVENRAQTFFAFAQGLLGLLTLRDIEIDPGDVRWLALAIAAQAAVGMEPD